MGSSLRPTMANVCLSFYELKWLKQFSSHLKPVFNRIYGIYVDDFFFFFNQLNISHNFIYILIPVILICLFHLNKKKNGNLSFLYVEVPRNNTNL